MQPDSESSQPPWGTFLPARVPGGIWGSEEIKAHDTHPFQSCADLETRVPSFNPARPLVQLSMPPLAPRMGRKRLMSSSALSGIEPQSFQGSLPHQCVPGAQMATVIQSLRLSSKPVPCDFTEPAGHWNQLQCHTDSKDIFSPVLETLCI